jgi:Tol biopolymer transport system component
MAIPGLLAWTPDGQGLAYAGPPAAANVWVAPIDGGAPRQLTRFTDQAIEAIAWSPDGSRLAIARTSPADLLGSLVRRD